ncbi:MAG: hypothetical protein JXR61_11025 [Prolixibacteraceae bacterium]|nr:hypothetical protein [Prolixibacteraceae bacterium]
MRVYLMLILVVIFSSCVRNKSGVIEQNTMQTHTHAQTVDKVFEVTEVIQASSYTYMKVKENMAERWVAVTKQEANVGDIYYYDNALKMNDFASKDLDRTFDEIYFVNQISEIPFMQHAEVAVEMPPSHSGKMDVGQSSVTMEKSGGELTIGKIFSDRSDFSGKQTEIRGVVVKVNNDIMDQNWVHIQDGTSDNGSFDLTITTQARVNVGDEVTFKGKIELDKDYTSGYFYDVIMTDAELVDSKQAM